MKLPFNLRLLLAVCAASLSPSAHAAINGVEVLVGGRTNLSGEGTLIQATNLGTTTSVNVPGVGTFTGDTGTDGLAGIAAIATTGGGTLNAADIGSAIDPLFFTETWNSGGTGMRVTVTLPDAGDFLVGLNGEESRSTEGGPQRAATVVIQSVVQSDSGYGDRYGGRTPLIETVGEGAAIVLRDGRMWSVTWERPSPGEGTRFLLPDGSPMPFAIGQEWVVLLDKAMKPKIT